MRSVIVALALSPAATALRPSPALRHSRRVPPLQNYAAAKAAAAAAKGGAPLPPPPPAAGVPPPPPHPHPTP